MKGNFDDAQTGVKRLFSSAEFREKMNAMGKLPSSANSINFGRLAPQIVYYFNAYTQLVQKHSIRMGQSVNFATSATFWRATTPCAWDCPSPVCCAPATAITC